MHAERRNGDSMSYFENRASVRELRELETEERREALRSAPRVDLDTHPRPVPVDNVPAHVLLELTNGTVEDDE